MGFTKKCDSKRQLELGLICPLNKGRSEEKDTYRKKSGPLEVGGGEREHLPEHLPNDF